MDAKKIEVCFNNFFFFFFFAPHFCSRKHSNNTYFGMYIYDLVVTSEHDDVLDHTCVGIQCLVYDISSVDLCRICFSFIVFQIRCQYNFKKIECIISLSFVERRNVSENQGVVGIWLRSSCIIFCLGWLYQYGILFWFIQGHVSVSLVGFLNKCLVFKLEIYILSCVHLYKQR
eukprot:TRINITY_DN92750_c0_g1_i2.p1 TRINITY_DN92750_c0_g1~~TRINITY_DN92750_c0_g1_i2.p1  ORF type:complete len:173 (-),score=3.38 TRINITY_DN92750_c0_g1_i2:67-585(-)